MVKARKEKRTGRMGVAFVFLADKVMENKQGLPMLREDQLGSPITSTLTWIRYDSKLFSYPHLPGNFRLSTSITFLF